MDILTPLQRQILLAIGQTPLTHSFYLTGGTALAAFYLYHRYSVDLDFFTLDPTAIAHVPPVLQQITQQLNLEISFTRTLDTFLECFLRSPEGERVEMDFAQDTPYRLEPARLDETLQINVDNLTDIACNKLSALFDRAEPKDFVDVYFLCQEEFSFEQLTKLAKQKHVGLDDYWLAVALRRVENVEFLPRMIKPLSLEELKAFFLGRAKILMEGIAKK
ncbi:MAG: nucleotidyl transferase AbiEii/AbiGii toxin family protein [Chloroflexi bacterium]|nr:nucleotidyl transferase AbiEii/AbiGii toxin family protein [Chloroflexota bacterium]